MHVYFWWLGCGRIYTTYFVSYVRNRLQNDSEAFFFIRSMSGGRSPSLRSPCTYLLYCYEYEGLCSTCTHWYLIVQLRVQYVLEVLHGLGRSGCGPPTASYSYVLRPIIIASRIQRTTSIPLFRVMYTKKNATLINRNSKPLPRSQRQPSLPPPLDHYVTPITPRSLRLITQQREELYTVAAAV